MLAGARAAERQLINTCPSNSSLASRRVFAEIGARAQVFRVRACAAGNERSRT